MPFTELFDTDREFKLYLWGCRSNQRLPVITAFSSKVKIKYETEKYICVKTNKMDKFNKKWALPFDSVPQRVYLELHFHFLYGYFTIKVDSVLCDVIPCNAM